MRVIAVFAALATLGLGSAVAANRNTPALRLLSSAPITVRGAHFQPRERVHVTLLAPGTGVVRVRTSAAGAFTARFAGESADRCSAVSIRAVGARGDLAMLKAKPLCPPA